MIGRLTFLKWMAAVLPGAAVAPAALERLCKPDPADTCAPIGGALCSDIFLEASVRWLGERWIQVAWKTRPAVSRVRVTWIEKEHFAHDDFRVVSCDPEGYVNLPDVLPGTFVELTPVIRTVGTKLLVSRPSKRVELRVPERGGRVEWLVSRDHRCIYFDGGCALLTPPGGERPR